MGPDRNCYFDMLNSEFRTRLIEKSDNYILAIRRCWEGSCFQTNWEMMVFAARVDVTLKFLEAELDPSSVASTVCGPGVEMGTVKLAKNTPLGVVVTVAGVVVTGAPSNVTSTVE